MSQQTITLNIGVHPLTISREFRCNRGLRRYRPKQIHGKAMQRHRQKPKAIRLGAKQIGYMHKKISETIKAEIYFTHPYASWERGTNENTNDLIRQYFPKGTRFEEITDEQIRIVQEKLNHRPRKTMGFKTPYEIFSVKSLKVWRHNDVLHL